MTSKLLWKLPILEPWGAPRNRQNEDVLQRVPGSIGQLSSSAHRNPMGGQDSRLGNANLNGTNHGLNGGITKPFQPFQWSYDQKGAICLN